MAYIPELIAFQETLASNYDLSTGAGIFTSADISEYNKFSLQISCTNFSGTAEMKMQQSLDGTSWDDIENSNLVLTASTCDVTIQQQFWISKYLRIVFITSKQGLMTINLLAKR